MGRGEVEAEGKEVREKFGQELFLGRLRYRETGQRRRTRQKAPGTNRSSTSPAVLSACSEIPRHPMQLHA
jgi:hypothetical protein